MTAPTAPSNGGAEAMSGTPVISPQRRNLIFLVIMFGMLRKMVFQAAVVFFVVGSVLCGLSQSMIMLVLARALQGIGSGGLVVTATALIGEVIPMRDRGRYQGALGAVFGVTTVIGPLLGGYFTDHLTWRWAFWINVPVSVVVLVVAAATIPALGEHAKPVIDYIGIVLVGLGAAGLTLATTWGGTTYPWGSAMIVGLFAGSTILLGVFVWFESRAVAPILPTRLFGDPVFTVCCVLSFVVGFAMLGALTFLPTYMQFVDGVSATTSNLRTLPMVLERHQLARAMERFSPPTEPGGVPSRHEPNRNVR